MKREKALYARGLPAGLTLREIFRGEDAFEAYYAACRWCDQTHVSRGSMQRDNPIGLAYGGADIAKWSNIPLRERRQLDGAMIFPSGDSRSGPVEIWLRDAP